MIRVRYHISAEVHADTSQKEWMLWVVNAQLHFGSPVVIRDQVGGNQSMV
jgi:hypothetical protein